MTLCRAVVLAACMFALAAGPAAAQFPPAPQQEQEPPCFKEFVKLRAEAQKLGSAIQAASERKASPSEACGLFNAFYAAEGKMVKYATDNAAWCGIPPQIIGNMKQTHDKTNGIRTKICKVAAAPQRSAGPSLSDALSAPVPDSANIKTGRGGTYDTLTGTPLGK